MATDAFTVSVVVSNPETGLGETVEASVGAGGAMAVMPASLLHRLGIEPDDKMYFRADDGGRVEYLVGQAHFSVQGTEGIAPVLFGPVDRCELGTNTLSDLLLEPDMAKQSLIPVIGLGLFPGLFLAGDDRFI